MIKVEQMNQKCIRCGIEFDVRRMLEETVIFFPPDEIFLPLMPIVTYPPQNTKCNADGGIEHSLISEIIF